MIIEIRKAGLINKGAELMLLSVLQKMKTVYPEATFLVDLDPRHIVKCFPKIRAMGLKYKPWFWYLGVQWGDFASLIPKKIRSKLGIVLDREVDIVLDSAGFAYSEQWRNRMTAELAYSSSRWRMTNKKIILLPQALGPYFSQEVKENVRTFVEKADLIFPREKISYKYLISVVGQQDKIKQYPDFTNLVKGVPYDGLDMENLNVCLIPNYRMIDKTSKNVSEAYLPFMIKCVRYLVARGAKPFILVHEGDNDIVLARNISDEVGGLPVIMESDPLKIKGILGKCDAIISSRYHGLVSGLSQGVPSFATGWSHKYSELLEDYGFREGILSVDENEEELYAKLDIIINIESNADLSSRLTEKSEKLKALSERMWENVFKEING